MKKKNGLPDIKFFCRAVVIKTLEMARGYANRLKEQNRVCRNRPHVHEVFVYTTEMML